MKENIQELAAKLAELFHAAESALTFSSLTHVNDALPRFSASLLPIHVIQLSAGGLLSLIDVYNASNAKRDRAGKAAAGLIRFLLSAPAVACEIALILVRFGVIAGAAATALATASAVVCTAVSCVFTISLALNWNEARQKANDPAYYIQNRLKKYDNLAETIRVLEVELKTSKSPRKDEIDKEIATYKIIQTRLLNQAFACYRYRDSAISSIDEKSNSTPKPKSNNIHDDTLGFLSAYLLGSVFLQEKLSSDEKNIVEQKKNGLSHNSMAYEKNDVAKSSLNESLVSQGSSLLDSMTGKLTTLTDRELAVLDKQQYKKQCTKKNELNKYLCVSMLGTIGVTMMAVGAFCPPALFLGIAVTCVAGFAGLALFATNTVPALKKILSTDKNKKPTPERKTEVLIEALNIQNADNSLDAGNPTKTPQALIDERVSKKDQEKIVKHTQAYNKQSFFNLGKERVEDTAKKVKAVVKEIVAPENKERIFPQGRFRPGM